MFTLQKIDVVVCAKNRARNLKRILPQILDKIPVNRLIVVYASSSDDTEKIARKYTQEVYWDGDNGLGAARNLGMTLSETEIVAAIDTDVILPDNWFERLIRHFSDPKVSAATGACIFGYGCKPIQKMYEYHYLKKRPRPDTYFGCSNVLLRKKAVLEVGNFRKELRASEDFDIHRRLLKRGYKWVHDTSVVTKHPMTMKEYIEHLRWWSESYIYASEFSVFNLFKDVLLISFSSGIKLALLAHPPLLVYYPAMKLIRLKTILGEMTKQRWKE